jgi:hypothetical protein
MIPKYPRGAAWTQATIGAAFLGAAIYLGSESNRLYDDLKKDRKKGALEQEDSRIARGRWFAVGADAGFAIGGVLGALATYNFIRDPLPESSIKVQKPVEFDDPGTRRPSALGPRTAPSERFVRKSPGEQRIEIAPSFGASSTGFSIGGKF